MKGFSFWASRDCVAKIRGRQICDHLGGKRCPTEGYKNDVCIFVKTMPHLVKKDDLYVDVVDDNLWIDRVKHKPYIGCIVPSQVCAEHLEGRIPNKIVCLPQHHCNLENFKRTRTEVTTVGFCGEYWSFAPFEKEIREKLSKIGMDLYFYHTYKNRRGVQIFHQLVDVVIVWRVQYPGGQWLRNQLKLSNAGSYGIPVVAYPEECFVNDYAGAFLPAQSIDEMVGLVNDLKNDANLYSAMSNIILRQSEKYHIDNIANLYRKLAQ